jgi:hypothetical protein
MFACIRASIRHAVLPMLAVLAVPALAGAQAPLRGTFVGQTVRVLPTANPDVVYLDTGGGGRATLLDVYSVFAPQFLDLQTGEVVGIHQFTAANGDLLIATVGGWLVFADDGFLVGLWEAVVTGGTGGFEGVTGGYAFNLILDPVTLTGIATLDGVLF